MSPRILSVVLLAALGLEPARAQEEKPSAPGKTVRLELVGGEVLEGRLDGFADRVYRVRLADGKVRQVREDQVARLELTGATPDGEQRSAATEVAGQVLARAASSGALAERVLGTHRFLLTWREHADETRAESTRRCLLLADVQLDTAAGELRFDLELLFGPGEPRDGPDLGTKGQPARFRSRVGLDGLARGIEVLTPSLEAVFAREGELWTASGRERGKKAGRSEEPWHVDLLPELLVAVLACLHDQGLPPSTRFRLLGMAQPDGAERIRHLRLVPGEQRVGEVPARVLEVTGERSGQPDGSCTRLFVGAGAPSLGRLLRVELEERSATQGVEYLRASTTLERIDQARTQELLEAWRCERAPIAPPAEAPAARADLPPPDELASLIAAARREGRLGPWERRFVLRATDQERAKADQLVNRTAMHGAVPRSFFHKLLETRRTVLVRVALRHEGERTVFEVEQRTVGDEAVGHVAGCTFDGEGRLIATHTRGRNGDHRSESSAERRGDRLHETSLSGPAAAWPSRARRKEADRALRPGSLPESTWEWLLPCLGPALTSRLRLEGLSTGGWELRRPVPVGPEGLALFAKGPPLSIPPGLRPASACVVGRMDGALFHPQWVAWLGPDGEHLGSTFTSSLDPRMAGKFEQDEPRRADRLGPGEVVAWERDQAALNAGRGLRIAANEDAARLHLSFLASYQASFRGSDPDRDGVPDYAASLDELARAGLLGDLYTGGVADGYRFVVVRAQDAPNERWLTVANPVRPGVDGVRSFAIDQTNQLLVGAGPIAPPPDARPPAGLTPDPEWRR